MKGLKNVNVYVEGKGIVKSDICFENGKINLNAVCDDEILKVSDDYVVVPGFIDEHIHGAGGYDAMDATETALSVIANCVASEGTTTFLATTMTQSVENISNALNNVKNYVEKNRDDGARVGGVHLEGPFIAAKFKGAQPLEYVVAPSVETFKKYNDISGNTIKIVSLAPEVEGSEELIKYLKQVGVVASIGHSGAKYDDIDKAINAGVTNVTHTYNAQSPLHHRDIGVVGSALLRDELNAELICDTIHVSVPAIKLVMKNKPSDKVTLITDAMRAKHMPDGESELGGQVVIVKNGEARLVDGTLAGSVLKMNDAIKNVVEKAGVPFLKAIDMATINPAKNIGLDDKIGSIKNGKNADITVINKNTYEIILTVRDGNVIYKK
ncbi:MAG: N-acetylglucosamine-6-phosphate deacetylase [Clostridia bacterium]|nr:N-acetylglucosamine-6-phosphate deacetylase [Clostridia bacterium]